MPEQTRSSFPLPAVTRLGWWAFGLGLAYYILYFLSVIFLWRLPEQTGWRQTLLPYYGIVMLLCGLLGGVLGLIALLRRRERSWMAWFSLIPGLQALILLLGEFLIPH